MQPHAHHFFLLAQFFQSIQGNGTVHVNPDYRAKTAGVPLYALQQVFVVVVAPVLDEGGLLDAVQVHLMKNHLHRLEPVNAGVGVGVDDLHI